MIVIKIKIFQDGYIESSAAIICSKDQLHILVSVHLDLVNTLVYNYRQLIKALEANVIIMRNVRLQ